MKTNFLSKAIAAGALAFLLVAPVSKADAQVLNPYTISNNLNCDIRVQYVIFDPGPSGLCDQPCDAGIIGVPAGAVIPIFWNPACIGCAVEISVLNVGGMPITPPATASFPGPPPHANAPVSANCSPTGMLNLMVHPHGADVNP